MDNRKQIMAIWQQMKISTTQRIGKADKSQRNTSTISNNDNDQI